MRAELLTYLSTATTSTTIKTSVELPWNTAGEPLYLKNMKKFYLDEDTVVQTTMFPTLDGSDVIQNDYIVKGYFAVDAKNTPTGLSSSISTILAAKNKTGLRNHGCESDYKTEIVDDVIIYTIEYRLNTTA